MVLAWRVGKLAIWLAEINIRWIFYFCLTKNASFVSLFVGFGLTLQTISRSNVTEYKACGR